MSIKVFIDGSAGTTGLQIYERLRSRKDISLLALPEELRKDGNARRDALNQADVAILCLPDEAAREAASWIENPETVVIDASTAHRVSEGWAYGFPELSKEHRAKIASSNKIANPGCYASGFLAIVYPLVKAGILPADSFVTCHAVSGYSGAGKKGIAQYEAADRPSELKTPRLYALTQEHKHLPEMRLRSGLTRTPIFNPYICDYYAGMTVSVPLFTEYLKGENTSEKLLAFYRDYYAGCRFVSASKEESGYLCADRLVGTNKLEILVHGNAERILLTARLDNLGKGASGAVIQNMNLRKGLDEGLSL